MQMRMKRMREGGGVTERRQCQGNRSLSKVRKNNFLCSSGFCTSSWILKDKGDERVLYVD